MNSAVLKEAVVTVWWAVGGWPSATEPVGMSTRRGMMVMVMVMMVMIVMVMMVMMIVVVIMHIMVHTRVDSDYVFLGTHVRKAGELVWNEPIVENDCV